LQPRVARLTMMASFEPGGAVAVAAPRREG